MDAGGTDLTRQLRRAERRRKLRAAALTLPLLAFLLVFFLVPLAQLLVRAVENPEVADALPRTGQALAKWDKSSVPPAAAYAAIVADLSSLREASQAGVLARRLNSEVAGGRSLVMGTYRALPLGENLTPEQAKEKLLAHDPRWGEIPYWQAIASNTSRWTPDYLLAAVDLKRTPDGHIERVGSDAAAFSDILLRTFNISAVVTIIELVMGYPLAYWLTTLS